MTNFGSKNDCACGHPHQLTMTGPPPGRIIVSTSCAGPCGPHEYRAQR